MGTNVIIHARNARHSALRGGHMAIGGHMVEVVVYLWGVSQTWLHFDPNESIQSWISYNIQSWIRVEADLDKMLAPELLIGSVHIVQNNVQLGCYSIDDAGPILVTSFERSSEVLHQT